MGAANYQARVFLNGQCLGTHRGGYDPFTFDVTDALVAVGPQEIVLAVWDPTNSTRA